LFLHRFQTCLLEHRVRQPLAVVLTPVLGQRDRPLTGLGHLDDMIPALAQLPALLLQQRDRTLPVEQLGHRTNVNPRMVTSAGMDPIGTRLSRARSGVLPNVSNW
jgi:hypothetical protein